MKPLTIRDIVGGQGKAVRFSRKRNYHVRINIAV
jgi:hypothetical protein